MKRNKSTKPSKREIEIFELYVKGMSRKAIADRLNISDDCVKSHLRNMKIKLGCKTLEEAKEKYLSEKFEQLNFTVVPSPFGIGNFIAVNENDYEARYYNKEENKKRDRS